MKDKLIDSLNRNQISKKRFLTVSAFSLAGANLILTLLIMHFKHSQVINMTDTTLIKSFFWNFG